MGQVGGWFPLARSEDIGLSVAPTVAVSGGCEGPQQIPTLPTLPTLPSRGEF